jgi:putrescine transport system substrate-binding protein
MMRAPAPLPATGLLLAALLAGCSGGGSAADDKVLNVYNWSDYIAPGVLEDFEHEYGIKVHYDVFDSNEVLETKMLMGHTDFDVTVPSGPFLQRQITAGVYRRLDKSLLPNLRYADPEVAGEEQAYDPGNRYGVDFMWITSGPGFNVQMIRARMPGAPMDSMRMVFDPAIVSKFADCGVTMLDAPTEMLNAMLLYLGRNPNSESLEDLDAAEKGFKAIRPYIRYVHSSRYINDLANGEVCLAFGWSGDFKQAHDRASEAGKGFDIVYRVPKEGAIRNFDMLAIPADAPHARNAHLFINFLLRPDIAARNTNYLKYPNGDDPALQSIDPGVRGDPGIYPPADALKRLHPELAKSSQFVRLLNRMWTRFKTGE